MAVWLHRISHRSDVSHPLLERGVLSIGFSDFSSVSFCENVRLNGLDALAEEFQKKWNVCSRRRFNLWNFVFRMKKGDRIVVPFSGVFSVYEIVGDEVFKAVDLNVINFKTNLGKVIKHGIDGLLYDEDDKIIDLGFFWKVNLVQENVPRRDYVDSALSSRMKILSTNADITDIEGAVDDALLRWKEKKPINLRSILYEKVSSIVLDSMLKSLDPDRFEKLVKWYFLRLGASRVFIPPKNETGKQGDCDVVAVFEPLKTIYYVQVKFHTGTTSDYAARQIIDYRTLKDVDEEGYSTIPWVVSSAEFSKECMETAKEHGVVLITGADFCLMLLDVGMSSLDEAFV
ncbi:restriction endonuclease [Desulfovibrio mangrovi]|uniref:restriction endonuclease n=1 Tax=Desulfovibrio mangrovi TaxID=2976983 RepID=UPI0022452E97|nr:restriction endonuclease [Desulfovibrio mangrovi]UZP67135.1 restriction endonuclease [Desulfovibrio mangrovi]